MGKFNSLFQPLEVRRCTIPNRIVMTPMGTNFAENTGEMSFLHIDYYEQRAQGQRRVVRVVQVVQVLSSLKTLVLTIHRDQMEQHSYV